MITQKINLAALKSAIRQLPGKDGQKVECIIIPIKENNLYKGQKGVYLDLVAFEIDPEKRLADSKQTHLLKQSFTKEKREQLGEEYLKTLPILGNITDWSQTTETMQSNELSDDDPEITDDLPW